MAKESGQKISELVGEFESLDLLAAEYGDEIFRAKIAQLQTHTSGLRRVKGDGNCKFCFAAALLRSVPI